MGIYKIVSHNGTGKALNFYGSGTITSRHNICLWSDTGSTDQQWSIGTLGTNQTVRSMNNTNYALNAQRTNWNCDVYTINSDSYVDFISLGNNVYQIQLKSNTQKYLTAAGTGNNSNVNWQGCSTSTAQKWKITKVSDGGDGGGGSGTSKSISFPNGRNCLWNQYDPVVKDVIGTTQGCTLISALNASNFYGASNYTIADMKDKWGGDGFTWELADGCAATLTGYTSLSGSMATLRSVVIEEINANRPLLIRLAANSSNGAAMHMVLAYGYKNGASTEADILVIDSYNPSSVKVAKKTTLDIAQK